MDPKSFKQFLLITALILAAWYFANRLRSLEGDRPPPPAEQDTAERPGQGDQPVTTVQAVEAEGVRLEQGIVLQNDLIRTLWTNRGAALERVEMIKEFKAPYKVDEKRPDLALLRGFQQGLLSDVIESITFYDAAGAVGGVRLDERLYQPVGTRDDSAPLVLRTEVGDPQKRGYRLRITKTVTIRPGDYHFSVSLQFENMSADKAYTFSLALRGPAGIEREELVTRHIGTRVRVREEGGDYKIVEVSAAKLDGRQRESLTDQDVKYPILNESAEITWAGLVNHYFLAVVQPQKGPWIKNVESRLVTDTNIERWAGRWEGQTSYKEADRRKMARKNAVVVLNTEPLQAPRELNYRFITAPKDDKWLEYYGEGLEDLIGGGWLGGLSNLVLWLLSMLHGVVRNYGVAILLLTAIIRLILHPLTRKSQVGMIKMQKLQPKLQEIQRKYADDRQKMSQEQVALFKKYGVSPFGGCMPMLVQLPVFIALFRALREAIVLRQAGFLYIDDLSRPDTVAYLPFRLPILGDQINILPVIMITVMLLQQRFMHQPAASEQARQQQKIFKWMPLMIGLVLYRMPSGLCLYWTTSTAIGVLERWLIDRKAKEIELTPVAQKPRETRGPPSEARRKKMGWMDRLEKWVDDSNKRARQSGRNRRKGK